MATLSSCSSRSDDAAVGPVFVRRRGVALDRDHRRGNQRFDRPHRATSILRCETKCSCEPCGIFDGVDVCPAKRPRPGGAR